MSRDSSRTYIHLHSPHHADLFEDFTSPPPTSSNPTDPQDQQHQNPPASNIPWSTSTPSTLLPSQPLGNHPSFPAEDILIPLHLLPPNPEDEDDMVPDQHAAFGINRALAGRERERAERWRDMGTLAERVRGLDLGGDVQVNGTSQAREGRGQRGQGSVVARAREGGRR